MSSFIWKATDGRKFKPSELSDNHLSNIIKLFYKRNPVNKIPKPLLEEYKNRFGVDVPNSNQTEVSNKINTDISELMKKIEALEKENSLLKEELFKYKNCKINHLI